MIVKVTRKSPPGLKRGGGLSQTKPFCIYCINRRNDPVASAGDYWHCLLYKCDVPRHMKCDSLEHDC